MGWEDSSEETTEVKGDELGEKTRECQSVGLEVKDLSNGRSESGKDGSEQESTESPDREGWIISGWDDSSDDGDGRVVSRDLVENLLFGGFEDLVTSHDFSVTTIRGDVVAYAFFAVKGAIRGGVVGGGLFVDEFAVLFVVDDNVVDVLGHGIEVSGGIT